MVFFADTCHGIHFHGILSISSSCYLFLFLEMAPLVIDFKNKRHSYLTFFIQQG
jgi:phosphate starvation-inducible membrane PsiE